MTALNDRINQRGGIVFKKHTNFYTDPTTRSANRKLHQMFKRIRSGRVSQFEFLNLKNSVNKKLSGVA